MDIFALYALSALLFWTLFLTPQLVQNTRQKLFNIRDKAFLEFEHDEAYYRFREILNTFIRFAHNASWQRLLYDFIILRKEIKQQGAIKTDFNNTQLNQLFLDGIFLITRLIYLRSPILILLSMPFLILIVIIRFEVLPQLRHKASILIINDANIYARH